MVAHNRTTKSLATFHAWQLTGITHPRKSRTTEELYFLLPTLTEGPGHYNWTLPIILRCLHGVHSHTSSQRSFTRAIKTVSVPWPGLIFAEMNPNNPVTLEFSVTDSLQSLQQSFLKRLEMGWKLSNMARSKGGFHYLFQGWCHNSFPQRRINHLPNPTRYAPSNYPKEPEKIVVQNKGGRIHITKNSITFLGFHKFKRIPGCILDAALPSMFGSAQLMSKSE